MARGFFTEVWAGLRKRTGAERDPLSDVSVLRPPGSAGAPRPPPAPLPPLDWARLETREKLIIAEARAQRSASWGPHRTEKGREWPRGQVGA